MRFILKIIFVLILFSITGCVSDDINNPNNGELKFYTDRFVDEAEKRGMNPNDSLREIVDKLSIQFTDSLFYYCGYAFPSTSTSPSSVIIRSDCWIGLLGVDKEILIFHELGHAILKRPHINTKLTNGKDYKSMMFDGNQFGLYSANSDRRIYYIDELFDESTPEPDWGK